jgi:hypothetical protein
MSRSIDQFGTQKSEKKSNGEINIYYNTDSVQVGGSEEKCGQ